MKSFRIHIKGYTKGVKENIYNVTASNYGTAVNRALKSFRNDFPNQRYDNITIGVTL